MKTISKDNVIKFQKTLIDEFGGLHGIKNEAAIESSLSLARASFDGNDLYRTTVEKISAVSFSLIANHPFNDGNKRIGVLVMLMLLELNEISVKFTQVELIDLGLGVASGMLKQPDIKLWIERHIL